MKLSFLAGREPGGAGRAARAGQEVGRPTKREPLKC